MYRSHYILDTIGDPLYHDSRVSILIYVSVPWNQLLKSILSAHSDVSLHALPAPPTAILPSWVHTSWTWCILIHSPPTAPVEPVGPKSSSFVRSLGLCHNQRCHCLGLWGFFTRTQRQCYITQNEGCESVSWGDREKMGEGGGLPSVDSNDGHNFGIPDVPHHRWELAATLEVRT